MSANHIYLSIAAEVNHLIKYDKIIYNKC